MRSQLFLLAIMTAVAAPAFAQLGPAGVPGAPGLVSTTPAPVEPAAPPPKESVKNEPPPKVPAACAKSKNVKQCTARLEARRKAKAACKQKADAEYKQCVSDYLNRGKK